MIRTTLEGKIKETLKDLGIEAGTIVLEHPADVSHGDYSTNVALAHAKTLGKNPRELAGEIAEGLSKKLFGYTVEVAGPGFINIKLPNSFFEEALSEILSSKDWGKNDIDSKKTVMVEYTQPNPFKPFHIGHLMSNAIGESISRIVEFSGARIVRANYQGDVGPHVAKAIWAVMKNGKPSDSLSVSEQAEYIGKCYSEGAGLYEENADIKKEIDAINKKVYDRSDEEINALYDWGREVTLKAFEVIYKTLGTKFDHYFFESVMAPIGAQIVRENLGPVFEDSDGAIVFKAEKYNPKLHTRVFINSQGLPTYEAKEIGLTMTKFEKENPDLSITTTAIEQGEYMKVVQQAISLIHPEYEKKMMHITHGMMRFASGKMSSRKGNVITGESLIKDATSVVLEKMEDRDFDNKEEIASQIAVAALRYSILKQALGGDIVYDFEKSISFEGDSGPYLQYTAVRAKAVLEKGKEAGIKVSNKMPEDWVMGNLEKHLYRFPEVVERARLDFAPHHISTYLTELASFYNSFYGEHKIVDTEDVSSGYRIALSEAFLNTMEHGAWLLGISIPQRM